MQTVVLIEKDERFRCTLKAALNSQAHRAVIGEASDGETAISLIQAVQPRVAIVGFRLPTISGLEVARFLRHYIPTTAVIIYTLFEELVLMTAHADEPVTVVSKWAPFSALLAAIRAAH
jgi:DNA-binding NarL/FixJ family response regulator